MIVYRVSISRHGVRGFHVHQCRACGEFQQPKFNRLARVQVKAKSLGPYLDCGAVRQASFQLQHSAGDLVAKGCFALMASMSRCSIGVFMTKAASSTASRTSAASRASTASMASMMMAVDRILVCCRRSFDGARVRVSPLEFGHQRRLGGASSCGSGATTVKHCGRFMKLIWTLI